jgi:hypothetical protein
MPLHPHYIGVSGDMWWGSGAPALSTRQLVIRLRPRAHAASSSGMQPRFFHIAERAASAGEG